MIRRRDISLIIIAVIIFGAFLFLGRTPESNFTKETVTKSGRDVPIIQDVPKDAIPPLDFPKYETVKEASWLRDDDVVLGVEFNGDARAYPIKILNWHEIVNEVIGDKEIVVTYCPLCNSGIVFDRRLEDRLLTFGNTGALYESAMVMYDRETESYWYQIGGLSIKGSFEDKRLTVLPSFLTTWHEWKKLNPNTKVLSLDTGFSRNYLSNPYLGYDELNSPPAFPVSITSNALPPKEKVVGVIIDETAKAYPVRIARGRVLTDEINGIQLEIQGDSAGQSAQIFFIKDGIREKAPVTATFWFSWFAAYPDTLIYIEDQ